MTGGDAAALHVRIRDGVTVAVPPALSAVTTYVLLEQEDWFEKEIIVLRRFLRPGMTAIDIGANLGVYSLRMARMVGPGGSVVAYEPGGEARALLTQSAGLNGLGNLRISGAALSDGAREGNLAFASSSELRTLGSPGPGERVPITSLDIEDAAETWGSVDFVKIDAEGEEERILAGGAGFFARHSPLVMFEIRAGDTLNERLRAMFPAMGYRLFRQLGDAPILVPDDPRQPLDGFELNLFAAKPDRAKALAEEGLLADPMPDWRPDAAAWPQAIAHWQRQAFAAPVNLPAALLSGVEAGYLDGLSAYAVWRNDGEPVATRCAALAFAVGELRRAAAARPSAERLSTFARVASEWGARDESVATLRKLFQVLQAGPIAIREPFWPACARYDRGTADQPPAVWFTGAAAEQFERTVSFSTAFSGASPVLAWLSAQPFAGTEMERRRVLIAAAAGQRPKVPARLCMAAPDHLNADIWRSGRVPGTTI